MTPQDRVLALYRWEADGRRSPMPQVDLRTLRAVRPGLVESGRLERTADGRYCLPLPVADAPIEGEARAAA